MTAHDAIADARARLAELTDYADETEAPAAVLAALALLDDDVFRLERAALAPIADQAPALETWRRTVLEHPRQFPPYVVAAAWELTALECERAGNTHGAERARREAGFALGIRGAA